MLCLHWTFISRSRPLVPSNSLSVQTESPWLHVAHCRSWNTSWIKLNWLSFNWESPNVTSIQHHVSVNACSCLSPSQKFTRKLCQVSCFAVFLLSVCEHQPSQKSLTRSYLSAQHTGPQMEAASTFRSLSGFWSLKPLLDNDYWNAIL